MINHLKEEVAATKQELESYKSFNGIISNDREKRLSNEKANSHGSYAKVTSTVPQTSALPFSSPYSWFPPFALMEYIFLSNVTNDSKKGVLRV